MRDKWLESETLRSILSKGFAIQQLSEAELLRIGILYISETLNKQPRVAEASSAKLASADATSSA